MSDGMTDAYRMSSEISRQYELEEQLRKENPEYVEICNTINDISEKLHQLTRKRNTILSEYLNSRNIGHGRN